MKTITKLATICVAASGLAACATVTRGDHTTWEVRTVPAGASVKTSNNMVCDSTPCSLKMSRRSEFDATITKAGYKPLTVHVTHKIGNAGGVGMAGNVVLGGVIGAGVDVASGAMYDLTPNPVDVTLEREDAPPSVGPATYQPAAPAAAGAAPAVVPLGAPAHPSPASGQQ